METTLYNVIGHYWQLRDLSNMKATSLARSRARLAAQKSLGNDSRSRSSATDRPEPRGSRLQHWSKSRNRIHRANAPNRAAKMRHQETRSCQRALRAVLRVTNEQGGVPSNLPPRCEIPSNL